MTSASTGVRARVRDGDSAGVRVVLVGGGPSNVGVVLRLAARCRTEGPAATGRTGEVVVVDRWGEAGGGAPHGAGTSAALLLNDRAADMDGTGIGFLPWVSAHRDRWLPELAADPDPRVARWVREHAGAVRDGRLGELFLPRILVGAFLRDRFTAAQRTLAAHGVSVRVLRTDAIAVRRGDGWLVDLADQAEPLDADAVVLGVGSPVKDPPPHLAAHPAFLGHPEIRDVGAFEDRLRPLLSAAATGQRRVVVLGSGAAACEVLYLVEGSDRLAAMIDGVTVVTRGAELPHGLPSGKPEPYVARELPDLLARYTAGTRPTSAELVRAVQAELANGRRQGYTTVDLLPAVGAGFDAGYAMLAPAERHTFVERDSPSYRAAIRHMSADYAAAVQRLDRRGTLRLTQAVVTDIASADSGELRVTGRHEGRPVVESGAAVIDCRGFVPVAETSHPLTAGLLRTGTAAANRCGRGLAVNDRLEAADGLFVLGPLLAGATGSDNIWSLETVPRIYLLADRVAGELHGLLAPRSSRSSTGGSSR
jgi:uncharacterized NAD(P)/FAD-binding protein YdhS